MSKSNLKNIFGYICSEKFNDNVHFFAQSSQLLLGIEN